MVALQLVRHVGGRSRLVADAVARGSPARAEERSSLEAPSAGRDSVG
jgi:hypothetical protein